jgi:hypothetical protein
MRAELAVLALALALALALPPASAHIVSFTQAAPLTLGPYNALVEPRPDPMYANSALSMTAVFSRAVDGTYANDLPAKMEVIGPNGYDKTTDLEPDGTGYDVASLAVPYGGNYTVKIIVTDQGQTYTNQTTVFAYPDLPVRIQSEDPNQPDPDTNVSFPIHIVTKDNVTLRPVDALQDLTLYLEHWSDDHRTLYCRDGSSELASISLSNEEIQRCAFSAPMKRLSTGLWDLDWTFPTSGMFHLQFSSASGHFTPADVPMLHVYARDAPAGPKKAPAPDGAWLVAALLGAVLLAAILRRRVH